MPNIVLHPETGQLSRVVESYEQVELAQLEAEATAKQAEVEAAKAELDAANKKHDEAVAVAEDSKSQLSVATGLVAQPADAATGEPTDESGTDVVHVPVENF